MNRVVMTFLTTVGLLVVAIAGVLATASGCIAAVEWASATLGSVAVLTIGAFISGCVITHAAHHTLASACNRVRPRASS